MQPVASSGRTLALLRARRLEYFTLAWNTLEALVSLVAGFLAGSIALIGFGLDSVIENGSATALLWRLRNANETTPLQRERAERQSFARHRHSLSAVGAIYCRGFDPDACPPRRARAQ